MNGNAESFDWDDTLLIKSFNNSISEYNKRNKNKRKSNKNLYKDLDEDILPNDNISINKNLSNNENITMIPHMHNPNSSESKIEKISDRKREIPSLLDQELHNLYNAWYNVGYYQGRFDAIREFYQECENNNDKNKV